MRKKIAIVIIVGILALITIYNNQGPRLGRLGYPSKDEIIRFYKNNKNELEYIQSITSVIDNSFKIMAEGYVHWNYEGEDKENDIVSKAQERYDENFKEGSRLLKISKKLFDSKWSDMIIGELYRDENGRESRSIEIYNSYEIGGEEYDVGITYLEGLSEEKMKLYQMGQIYQDNHIDGNWYYFCRYKPRCNFMRG